MKKQIFKNEIREILLMHILAGQYQPGERLSLPTIAKDLEVSVTPIREALTQLSETGIISYVSNRGFFLSELSADEAQEIYEIMAVLECHALRHSNFTKEQLNDLTEVNAKLAKAIDPIDNLRLDREFHSKLIENYANNHAIRIITNLRVQISLYEIAFWNNSHNRDSVKIHAKIIQSIKKGDLSSAVNLLEQNWMSSVKYILSKLQKVT